MELTQLVMEAVVVMLIFEFEFEFFNNITEWQLEAELYSVI